MKIDEIVSNAESIVISGHVKPDGDCVGSVLALYNYLLKYYPEKKIDLFLEEPNKKLEFLYGFNQINSAYEPFYNYDLGICLDCASLERLGKAIPFFEAAKHKVCIDHHISNTYFADENYVYPDMSSACECLFNHLDYEKMDKNIATCLYTGIVYDTGVFKYSLTSPATMRVVADLMEFGVPAEYIIDESFYAKTFNENRIMGYALLKSQLCYEGRCCYSFITEKEMKEYDVTTKDLEGVVPQLRLTKGVNCALFLYETGLNEYKASLRSTGEYDVNKVASVFGGGGHIKAAGCTVCGELDTCIEALLIEIGKTI